MEVGRGAAVEGMELAALRQRLGIQASVLAMIKPDGQAIANPTSATAIGGGDVLIVLGQAEELRLLATACASTRQA
jgi:K+/H+ antiporter YhaU regulatory subunit KhtT